MRKPIEVWPLGHFLAEEMIERGWTASDVAERMAGEFSVNALTVDLYLAISSERMIFGIEQAAPIANAFDISPEFLIDIHRMWVENPQARQEWECPDHLFSKIMVSLPSEH